MCRLYGFRATEETKVECTLVHAQNALIVQAEGDLTGREHAHGWGVATYRNGTPKVEKQASAAFHGEHFSRAAERAYAATAVAHVRRATVGGTGLENTHPFHHGSWVFAHNGTVFGFEATRDRFLDRMLPEHREAIRGTTDSEHLFHMLLSMKEKGNSRALIEVLRDGLREVLSWDLASGESDASSLNVIWTDGVELVASRVGRTLWYTERRAVLDCEICGSPHVRHSQGAAYRAVVVASEPLTHGEEWTEVPERTLLRVGPESDLELQPL